MEFGMPTLIEQETLEETVKLCKDLGLDFVELNMNLPQYQVEILENTSCLKELKEKYQVYFTIHLDENFNVADFNNIVSEAYIQTVKRAIRVAKIIDAPILNMHMNHGVHFTLPNKKVELFEKYSDFYMESIKRFREICEEEIGNDNIRICIENTDGYKEYEKNAINYLLDSSVFGLTFDIGHSNGVNNIDEEFIMKNKNKLIHFHIHDGQGKKNHLELGVGEIDLYQRLNLAKECKSRCVVETKTIESLINSVKWLKSNI